MRARRRVDMSIRTSFAHDGWEDVELSVDCLQRGLVVVAKIDGSMDGSLE